MSADCDHEMQMKTPEKYMKGKHGYLLLTSPRMLGFTSVCLFIIHSLSTLLDNECNEMLKLI